MKSNTKSSITLPSGEFELVLELKAALQAKSNVEVVRQGLRLLKEATDRESLRQAYERASLAVRDSAEQEIGELDSLVAEGLEDW